MTFLYLSSDRMGEGDDDLGRRLLTIFLAKLAASDVQVDVVGCVNDGIRLTTSPDAPALDSLRTLQARGARIVSCSTCLEHHQLSEQLQLGEVGTMDGTVQILAIADRVIRP